MLATLGCGRGEEFEYVTRSKMSLSLNRCSFVRRLVLGLLFDWAFALLAQSQTEIKKCEAVYVSPKVGEATSVLCTPDDKILVAGVLGQPDRNFNTPDSVLVMCFDRNLDTLWVQTYMGPEVRKVYQIRQTTDGGYLILGEATTLDVTSSKILLIKIDSVGHLVWEKRLGRSRSSSGQVISVLQNGGVLIAGSQHPNKLGWLCTTGEGTVTLERQLKISSQYVHAIAMVPLERDTYALLCGSFSFLPPSAHETFYLLIVDSGGKVKMIKRLGATRAPVDLRAAADGGFVLVGKQMVEQEAGGYVSWDEGFAMRISPKGDSIWAYDETLDRENWIQRVLPIGSGDFLTVGSAHSKKEFGYDIVIHRIASTGIVIDTTRYGDAQDLLVNDARFSSSGKLIVAGKHRQTSDYNEFFFVAILDTARTVGK